MLAGPRLPWRDAWTWGRLVRALVVDTYYPALLDAHYADREELGSRPYAEQLSSLIGRRFGTSDAYSRYLRELGHDSEDLIVNCRPLQARWAAENVRIRHALWRLRPDRREDGATQLARRIALAQVEAWKPDVLYVQNLSFFGHEELARIRARGVLVAGQIASPPPPDRELQAFDLITTSFPHFVERFRALGIDSEYLRIAFYEPVLDDLRKQGVDPSPGSKRPFDVAFVGGLDSGVHGSGVALLERISREIPLDVWGYGADRLPATSPLLERYHGEAWGLDMYGVLAQSRIVVNRHIDAAEGHANNMRLFEATGVGALLVTEDAQNLGDMFEPGREVVTYNGPDDLIEKVRHYLRHDEERAAVAAAGQARTLSEHTTGSALPSSRGCCNSASPRPSAERRRREPGA